MKNLLKKLPFVLILLLAVLFNGCEKDLYEEQIRSSKNFKIKEVKFDDLFKDEKFNSLMRSINNNDITSRSAFEDQFGFTIYNDKVRIIENDTIISYTMLILRDGVTDKSYFENLVLQKDIYNNKKGAIYKYIPEEILPTAHNSFKFEGDIIKTILKLNGDLSIGTEAICAVTIKMCCQAWPNIDGVVLTDPHPATEICNNPNFTWEQTFEVICAPNDGGFGPSGGEPVNWDPGFGNGPTPGGGGGPSDPITPTAPQDYQVPEIITSPVLTNENVDEIRNINLFYQSLTAQQRDWADANSNQYNQLIQYLIENNWSDESKQFTKEFINNKNIKVCLGSFSFSDVGSNWQNAGVSNINIQFITIGGIVAFQNVHFSQLHFGFPKEQSNAQYITNNNARYFAQDIMTQAEALTNAYQSINPTSTANQLKTFFYSKLQEGMAEFGGTISTSAPLGWSGTLREHQTYFFSSTIECD